MVIRIAHHHFSDCSSIYCSGSYVPYKFWIGHSMREILDAHTPPANGLGNGHKGYTTLSIIHYISAWSSVSFRWYNLFTGRSTCTPPPYAFLAQDFTTQASLYTSPIYCWFILVLLHTDYFLYS
jgi:photosystem I P700 chlorophyll a apoprotein A2